MLYPILYEYILNESPLPLHTHRNMIHEQWFSTHVWIFRCQGTWTSLKISIAQITVHLGALNFCLILRCLFEVRIMEICLVQSIFPVCYEEHKIVAIKDLHQKDHGLSATLVCFFCDVKWVKIIQTNSEETEINFNSSFFICYSQLSKID